MPKIIRPEDYEIVDPGAPTFYCPYWPKPENNGDGNLIFPGCIIKARIAIVQCFVVMPAVSVFESTKRAQIAAADALTELQMYGCRHDDILRN